MSIRLTIRVTPQASTNHIKIETHDDGSMLYRVYVTVPPEDGKANKEVIKLLAKHFGVAKSRISLVRGHTSKDKIIEIDGLDDI
jgi:uncharacterized protein (TIGR00251 family)